MITNTTAKPKSTWRDRYRYVRSPATIAREQAFLAGCDRLESTVKAPGHCFTQEEIAAATGVTQQRIHELETKALQKIRNLPGFSRRELAKILKP